MAEYAYDYEVPEPAHNLRFPKGEGSDALYDLPSSFTKATVRYSDRTMPRSSRDFSYLKHADEEEPGPGAYDNRRPAIRSDRGYSIGSPSKEERLRFPRGEGADFVYDAAKSSFAKASASRGASFSTFGNAERFNTSPTGGSVGVSFGSYSSKANDDVPGPGEYNVSPQTSTSLQKAHKIAKPVIERASRLDFAAISGTGESPGPIYDPQPLQGVKSARNAPTAAFGSTRRFVNTPLDVSSAVEDTPGPGAYGAASSTLPARRPASAPIRRPSSARSSSRLDFKPSEGAEPQYRVHSQFDKYAQKGGNRPSSSMGGGERFRRGVYRRDDDEEGPGPGAYDVRGDIGKRIVSAATPRRSEVGVRKTASSAWIDAARTDVEVPGPIYDIPSQFSRNTASKAGASIPKQRRFAAGGGGGDDAPGPGAYLSERASKAVLKSSASHSFASPRMRPPGWQRPVPAKRGGGGGSRRK